MAAVITKCINLKVEFKCCTFDTLMINCGRLRFLEDLWFLLVRGYCYFKVYILILVIIFIHTKFIIKKVRVVITILNKVLSYL